MKNSLLRCTSSICSILLTYFWSAGWVVPRKGLTSYIVLHPIPRIPNSSSSSSTSQKAPHLDISETESGIIDPLMIRKKIRFFLTISKIYIILHYIILHYTLHFTLYTTLHCIVTNTASQPI